MKLIQQVKIALGQINNAAKKSMTFIFGSDRTETVREAISLPKRIFKLPRVRANADGSILTVVRKRGHFAKLVAE